MRPSPRWLNALERLSYRPKSISFIGLGRMGHEMAYNLFSKQYTRDTESQFVVCDAIPDSAQTFCSNFLGNFPGVKISIASTPEEYVFRMLFIFCQFKNKQGNISLTDYNHYVALVTRSSKCLQSRYPSNTSKTYGRTSTKDAVHRLDNSGHHGRKERSCRCRQRWRPHGGCSGFWWYVPGIAPFDSTRSL
jgi:NAD binding domain of 6-phosphogluconate dehydrogenase